MSGDPFKHVHSGDPVELHHASFNAMLDAGRDFRARRGLGSAGADGFPWTPGHIRVRNTSGAARDRGDILGLAGPTITPTENLASYRESPTLDGVAPTASHCGRFAILLKPLPPNAIGPALIAGQIAVKLEVGHEAHMFADIVGVSGYPSTTKLNTGFVGAAEILWKESGTGEKWGIVRIGSPTNPTYFCKPDADLYKNNYGTVSIHDSNWTDTGADQPNTWNYTMTVKAGSLCALSFVRGTSGEPWKPILTPISCG